MVFFRTINTLCTIPKNVRFSIRLYSYAAESNMQFVLKNISSMLSCNEQTAKDVYEKFPSIRAVTALVRAKKNIVVLTENGVSKQLIGDNPFLLNLELGMLCNRNAFYYLIQLFYTSSTDALHRKLEMIKRMHPRHIDDFVPLLEMREPILRDVADQAVTEYNTIPERSRIYYLSRELRVRKRIWSLILR